VIARTSRIPSRVAEHVRAQVVAYTVAPTWIANPTREDTAHQYQLYNILSEENRFKLGEDITLRTTSELSESDYGRYVMTTSVALPQRWAASHYDEYSQIMTGSPRTDPGAQWLARAFGVFDHCSARCHRRRCPTVVLDCGDILGFSVNARHQLHSAHTARPSSTVGRPRQDVEDLRRRTDAALRTALAHFQRLRTSWPPTSCRSPSSKPTPPTGPA